MNNGYCSIEFPNELCSKVYEFMVSYCREMEYGEQDLLEECIFYFSMKRNTFFDDDDIEDNEWMEVEDKNDG